MGVNVRKGIKMHAHSWKERKKSRETGFISWFGGKEMLIASQDKGCLERLAAFS